MQPGALFDPIIQLELAEMAAFADVYRAAREDVVKAGGLGVVKPVSDLVVAAVLNAFAEIGSLRFFVAVAPVPGGDDLATRLDRVGVRPYNNWMRLRRDLMNLPTMTPAILEVRRIGATDGETFWTIVAHGFGYPATHRGRGAQTALIIRRLADAAAAGCRWVSVETAEDTVESDAPSFRNLQRLGFDIAYRRPNYLWTTDGLPA